MRIKNIKLTNFRNYTKAEFDFDSRLTLIKGPNGVGKTNILEAIYLTATVKSPRTHYDRDVINYDKEFCTILAETLMQEEKYSLELQIIKSDKFENASSKRAKVNKTPKTIHYFAGIFNAVLFMPEDILLVTESPSRRRRYIDMVLSQTDDAYKRTHTLYLKALKRRNKVLEMLHDEDKGHYQINYWDDQILEHGQFIQQKRDEFFNYISEKIMENSAKLGGNGEKDSEYKIIYKKNEITKERIDKYRQKEILARSTLVGPHRDDFEIYFDGHNLAHFGSRGQQRTAILALKLSEMEFIEHKTGEHPVLLLDDIFSELDTTHRKTVIKTIKHHQTIITSAEDVDFVKDAKIIEL